MGWRGGGGVLLNVVYLQASGSFTAAELLTRLLYVKRPLLLWLSQNELKPRKYTYFVVFFQARTPTSVAGIKYNRGFALLSYCISLVYYFYGCMYHAAARTVATN